MQKVTFSQKSLKTQQTVAELLTDARDRKGFSIEYVAEQLQISVLYLEALEQGRYEDLPCLVYTRNFVKKCAVFLQVDMAHLLRLFDHEWSLFEKVEASELEAQPKQTIQSTDFWKMPRWLRWMGATLVISSFVGYLGFELVQLRQAPELVIITPEPQVTQEKQLVQVQGQADPEAVLTINNQPILSNSNGSFDEKVALQPGINIVEIRAKKKYSQESIEYREIYVEPLPAFSQADAEDVSDSSS